MYLRSGRNKSVLRIPNPNPEDDPSQKQVVEKKMTRSRIWLERFKKLQILVMPLRTLVLLAVFVLMIALSVVSKLCDRLSGFLMYQIFIYYGGGVMLCRINSVNEWYKAKTDGIRERVVRTRAIFTLPELPVVKIRAPITIERRVKDV